MSENKQEKRETLADIVADMRKAGALMTATYMRDLLNYADRIEAAWRRERAEIEANALSVGGIVEAARHKPGNAAAMREALKTIHDKVNSIDEECGVDPVEIRDIARAALSAPPRNCDVGTPEEQGERCLAQFNEWRRKGVGREVMIHATKKEACR